MKKWNWGTFGFIMVIAALGALTNESVDNIEEWLFIVFGLGMPLAFLFVWISKEEE